MKHDYPAWICSDCGEKREADKAAHAATIEGILKSHEAFRQEVSNAVFEFYGGYRNARREELLQFIIVKPDPLFGWVQK